MKIGLKRRSTEAILVLLTYVLAPLYLLPSGSVQLVDIAIIALFITIFNDITVREFRESFKHITPFIPFVIWTLIVNICYTISRDRISYVLASVEIIYTILILLGLSISLKRLFIGRKYIDYMFYTILGSCIITMLFPKDILPSMGRTTLSFNNPNQLAYYSLLILTSVVLINYMLIKNHDTTPVHVAITIVVTILANAFVFMSASRAGLISCILTNIILLYIYIKEYAIKTLIVIPIVIVIALPVGSVFSKGQFISKAFDDTLNRFRTTQIMDMEDMDQRTLGYFKYKGTYSVIYGDGGIFEPDAIVQFKVFFKEVHNSVLGIFLAYGIIGGILFLAAAAGFYWQMRLPYRFFLLLPIIIFNMTLYGLRFRFFWMTMALLSAVSSLYSTESREPGLGAPLRSARMHLSAKNSA
jgi:hypothetical protein